MTSLPASINEITQRIVTLRGARVILDRDLATLFGVSTKRLNESIKRNISRFPADFMFRLTSDEWSGLRSQFATSKTRTERRGGARYTAFAFTEFGAIPAANVLNSPRAVEMGVHVVRAFIKLRDLLISSKELSSRLDELEGRYAGHDQQIAAMLGALRNLLREPKQKNRGIGFTADLDAT